MLCHCRNPIQGDIHQIRGSCLKSIIFVHSMTYVYLAIAIIGEVAATSALKASAQFSHLLPSIIVVLGYTVAFYCLSIVLKQLPVGITYAIWAGAGVVLVALVAMLIYHQIPDIPALIGMGLIISGVAVIHLFSDTIGH